MDSLLDFFKHSTINSQFNSVIYWCSSLNIWLDFVVFLNQWCAPKFVLLYVPRYKLCSSFNNHPIMTLTSAAATWMNLTHTSYWPPDWRSININTMYGFPLLSFGDDLDPAAFPFPPRGHHIIKNTRSDPGSAPCTAASVRQHLLEGSVLDDVIIKTI